MQLSLPYRYEEIYSDKETGNQSTCKMLSYKHKNVPLSDMKETIKMLFYVVQCTSNNILLSRSRCPWVCFLKWK